MKNIIHTLTTEQQCENLEKNATKSGRLDLALAARKKGIELRARARGATNDVERECLEAVFAYERVLSQQKGKKTRANRTWPMIKKHGILGAVERAVNRPSETSGYRALVDMGLEDFAFEAVILRHAASFSDETVRRAEERISERASS